MKPPFKSEDQQEAATEVLGDEIGRRLPRGAQYILIVGSPGRQITTCRSGNCSLADMLAIFQGLAKEIETGKGPRTDRLANPRPVSAQNQKKPPSHRKRDQGTTDSTSKTIVQPGANTELEDRTGPFFVNLPSGMVRFESHSEVIRLVREERKAIQCRRWVDSRYLNEDFLDDKGNVVAQVVTSKTDQEQPKIPGIVYV